MKMGPKPKPAKPAKYSSLSMSGRELLSHLQQWKFLNKDELSNTRLYNAMRTLIHHGLAEYSAEFSVYLPTDKGLRVKGWAFRKGKDV